MNGFKIFIILVMIFGTIQTVSAQNNDSERELKISDDEKVILFAGFSIAVIAIFLFLARDVILRKKTTYDKQEHESKKDKTYEKIISNIEEIKSRKGKIIIVTDSKDKILKDLANDLIYVPKTNHYMFCVLATIVLQLFAYYIAVGKKLNVDRPRNLAKSVTVE